jgi:hypothetical protein
MKEYKKPTVTVIDLTLEDVIVTSGGETHEFPSGNDDYTDNNFWGAN